MLTLVNKNSASLKERVANVSIGDVVLLIEDAVFSAIKCDESLVLNTADSTVSVYALLPDMQARGVVEAMCYPHITFVDYVGFVELVVNNNPVRSVS